MLFNCYLNSSIVEMSYADIKDASGIQSKATISKCLKELIEKEMISKMSRSIYRLWYVSKKEAQEAQERLEIECESSNAELSNPTPNTPYKDNIIISRHEEIEKDDDSFDNQNVKNPDIPGSRSKKIPPGSPVQKFKFRPGSPFSALSNIFLLRLTKRFGHEAVQARITKLEKCYYERFDKINSPAGLLYSALYRGNNWGYQNREDTERDKNSRERIREEKKMEKYWWEQKQIERQVSIQNVRLKELEKNPVIYAKCVNRVKEMQPNLEEGSGMFKFLLRNKLLEELGGMKTPDIIIGCGDIS
jgi:hypothetical protein